MPAKYENNKYEDIQQIQHVPVDINLAENIIAQVEITPAKTKKVDNTIPINNIFILDKCKLLTGAQNDEK